MLWLGANVMLEYDIDESQALLAKNKTNAISSLEEVKMQIGKLEKKIIFFGQFFGLQNLIKFSFLAYLRDQMTTTEVSMARVYNWDVNRRKAENKPWGACVRAPFFATDAIFY